jgi:hypothetical protein
VSAYFCLALLYEHKCELERKTACAIGLVVEGFLISTAVFSFFWLWGIAHALRDSLFFIKVSSFLEA